MMSIVQVRPTDPVHAGAVWASAAIESLEFPFWLLTHPSHWGWIPLVKMYEGSHVAEKQLVPEHEVKRASWLIEM